MLESSCFVPVAEMAPEVNFGLHIFMWMSNVDQEFAHGVNRQPALAISAWL